MMCKTETVLLEDMEMEKKYLLSYAEVGKILNWDRKKVRVYYLRGKLPSPQYFLGDRPLWTPKQIEEFKKSIE